MFPSPTRRTAAVVVLASLAVLPAVPAHAAAQTCFSVNGMADAACTPGAFNSDVAQGTIGSTICVSGWTATVRPSSSYTTRLKNEQKIAYGEADIPNTGLEEDHLVPLELGGAPADPANLWPEPRAGWIPSGETAGDKDTEENRLKRQVCAGSLTLAEARTQILTDWTR
ncbi:MAG: hypothetical protein JWO79_1825 [Actinomycetia bacterium]|jgi:hypothetical protein|nr:hypothetical protein [Actinomycetes bacterium]MDQ1655715.1 hypothetical protein [Cryptosporangiaceae bacterium]